MTLIWVGSGALAAFDGLLHLLNRLFLFGTDAFEPGWRLTDTIMMSKVLIGCWPPLWEPWPSQPPRSTTSEPQNWTTAGPL